ncbi:MAG: L-histidine N(alpha)-methyltransferase [Gammaproteobacteria bacterium]|nr:L-histidine N(alpha)-methyltransferase [Gammaproteobacteria bacterium]
MHKTMTGRARQYPPRDGIDCLRVTPSRPVPGLLQDARSGLLESPRSMPPKYFYDERGAHLFDAICDTQEYYPTRTEEALLQQHAREIISLVKPDHIIEFGSGTSRKTRHLLDACAGTGRRLTYWPFDVCEPVLRETGHTLMQDYDWLNVSPLLGDYHAGLDELPVPQGSCLYLFLGGTIGNFDSPEAHRFLVDICNRMRAGDYFVMGADRVKAHAVLHAAYNDAEGITDEFNLNLLEVLNRGLDADFDPDRFSHRAVYNDAREQIEMYLVARERHQVRIGALDCDIRLQDGESILTEISRKFSVESLQEMLTEAGYTLDRHYQPDNRYYSLLLARPAAVQSNS